MGKLEGRVAVLTASTTGIGFAMAKEIGLEGASIVVCSRRKANVDSAVNELQNLGIANVIGVVCQVTKKEDRHALLNAAVKAFNGIDILISNAGSNRLYNRTIMTCPESEWDNIFDVNVKSALLLTQEAVPYLKKSKAGRIIYLSSIVGVQPRAFSLGAYSVSKAALNALTKTVAAEMGPHNITVNCIAPGVITTNFASKFIQDDFYIQRTLLKRVGTPDEVAGLTAFLCTDSAAYITGEVIVVGGGMKSRI